MIRILEDLKFAKYIVLEDYHYLPIEVQREVAIDLKAFHEKSDISFIVVGVWLEQNRLALYNGDLMGRVVPIEADEWTGEELFKVIEAGEQLLNIKFPEKVVSGLIAACQGNVGLLQEACHLLCDRCAVFETQGDLREVGSVEMLDHLMDRIASEQSGRYSNFIADFAQGFKNSKNEMYKWLIACVITANPIELKAGIRQSDLLSRMKRSHANAARLQQSNVAQALKNIARLQQQKRIQPVILDFNEKENRLRVVDVGLILFLSRKQKADLLGLISMELRKESS